HPPEGREMRTLAILLAAATVAAAEDPAFKTFDAKGVKLQYMEQGKGEPVVLIHGLHSGVDLNWKKPGILDELAKDVDVSALNLPGHGNSDKPDKAEAYGAQMAEDVKLLLGELKIEKAHIVGYSLGGLITLKFLAEYQDLAISGLLGGAGWMKEGGVVAKSWD